ncbi:MAG TPA: bifunctional riboflavin kinase/FAD synthetase [Mobilitalea sp.]|nr:bifunctional riboflavin kinase/FAD synthetase [Mobilitalea sp.]
MEYIAGSTDFKFKNTAVTLGKFDGIHLGHQQLIQLAISYKEQGLKAVMFSFQLHPGNLFSDKEFELIYSEEEKLAKLNHSGIDVLISYPFTEETRSMDPEDFIKKILVDKLDTKIIIVGNDFHFGFGRRGDVAFLKEYEETYGYKVIACEKKKWKNEVISSSAIRYALKEGNLEVANAMLGQPYSIRGEVVHGRRFGRTIGMPTTNIIPPSTKLLPPCGVYATKTLIDGVYHPGVTNIGYKPTVGTDEYIGVETYIFDYDNDLYGEILEVEFYTYIRPEMKFGSIEELVTRMREDIIITRNTLKLIN